MNKIMMSLSLLSTSLLFAANTFALTLDEIEEQDQACNKSAVSTTDMLDCGIKKIEGYDKILKAETKDKLANSDFNKAFKKWETFTSKVAFYVGQRHAGTIDSVNASSFVTNEKLNMIKLLQDDYWSDFNEGSDTAEIADEYNSCIEEADKSTEACFQSAFDDADKLLNDNYKLAMKQCTETYSNNDESAKNCKSLLKSGEIAWIDYKEAFADFLKKSNNSESSQIFLINTTLRQAELLGPREEGDVF